MTKENTIKDEEITISDDIVNKNFELIQSDIKSMKELCEEIQHDFDTLQERLNNIEDQHAEKECEDVHNKGKIDECYTKEQKERIRKWKEV